MTDKEFDALEATTDALLVMLTDSKHLEWLQKHDPQAVQQGLRALRLHKGIHCGPGKQGNCSDDVCPYHGTPSGAARRIARLAGVYAI